MHTARLLIVSPSMHCTGGGGICSRRGVSAPGRGVCSGGRGCLLLGGGVVVPQHTLRQTPPPLWTEFLTHATETITLPQTSFAGGNYQFIMSIVLCLNLNL